MFRDVKPEMTVTERARAYFMEMGRGDLAEAVTDKCTNKCCKNYTGAPHIAWQTDLWLDNTEIIIKAFVEAHRLAGHNVEDFGDSLNCDCFNKNGKFE